LNHWRSLGKHPTIIGSIRYSVKPLYLRVRAQKTNIGAVKPEPAVDPLCKHLTLNADQAIAPTASSTSSASFDDLLESNRLFRRVQGKARQGKAKQSKAKQSKAKQAEPLQLLLGRGQAGSGVPLQVQLST
jgi:hypothetical protein